MEIKLNNKTQLNYQLNILVVNKKVDNLIKIVWIGINKREYKF